MATIDLGKIKLVWRGTYDASTAYTVDDVVQHTDSGLTSSFICTTASTGNAPSTSGTVHGSWAYLAKGAAGSVLTTQGDILYRDGSGDQRLAKGTASQVLTMNSGATAPEWVTASGGTVLQLKTVQCGTHRTTTNGNVGLTAYELTDYTTTFTPTSATSHILITGQMAFGHDGSYVGRGYLTYNHSGISETMIRGNVNSYGCTWRIENAYDTSTSRGLSHTGVNIHLAPATTNEITFKVRIMSSDSSAPTYINNDDSNSTNSNDGACDFSSLTFWEIASGITPVVANSAIDT